jgi:putative transposase
MGATYFVTSRLADSLPATVLQQWHEERKQWLKQRGVSSAEELDRLSPTNQREFKRIFTAKWHQRLDAGYGGCVLKEPEVAQALTEEFIKGHSTDDWLDAWVIMPNHWHVLVAPCRCGTLSSILQRWKGTSAKRINQLLNRHGTLWQKEAFDHIVRNNGSSLKSVGNEG